MSRFAACLIAVIFLAAAPPVAAGVNGFVIVNATGAPLTAFQLRRRGASEWGSLPVAAAVGARITSSFVDADCAFDIRAAIPKAGPVMWSGVNLCDVKSVTLHRDASGRTWVDYD